MKKEYHIVQLNYADGSSIFYILIRRTIFWFIPFYGKYGFRNSDGSFKVKYFDSIWDVKEEVKKLENEDSSVTLVSKEIHKPSSEKKKVSCEPQTEMKQNVGIRDVTFPMEMVVSIDSISELIPIMEVKKFDKWLFEKAFYYGQGAHSDCYDESFSDESIVVQFTVSFKFIDIGLL